MQLEPIQRTPTGKIKHPKAIRKLMAKGRDNCTEQERETVDTYFRTVKEELKTTAMVLANEAYREGDSQAVEMMRLCVNALNRQNKKP